MKHIRLVLHNHQKHSDNSMESSWLLAELALEIQAFPPMAIRELDISLFSSCSHDGNNNIEEEPDWWSEDAAALFQVLGNLPKIKAIRLHGLGISSTSTSTGFPLHHLTQLLYHSNRWRRLRSLELTHMKFCLSATTATTTAMSKMELWDFVSTLIHLRRLRRLVVSEWMFSPQQNYEKEEDKEPDNNRNKNHENKEEDHHQRQQHHHHQHQQYRAIVIPWTPSTTTNNNNNNQFGIFCREVLNGIFCLTKLETLSLQGCGPGAAAAAHDSIPLGTIGGECLSSFVCPSNHERLEELTLLHVRLDAAALLFLAGALRRNETLHKLELDLRHSAAFGAMSLFGAFRHNHSIATAELWIPHNNYEWQQEECLQYLAKKLIKNTTLLELVIKSSSQDTPKGEQQSSLSSSSAAAKFSPSSNDKNENQQSYQRGPPRFQDNDARAFLNMLESNCFGPITLCLDDYHERQGKWSPLIQLHTHMNCEGSRRRCGSCLDHIVNHDNKQWLPSSPEKVSPELWIELLLIAATTKTPVSPLYRVDALFQLLQQHPSMICNK